MSLPAQEEPPTKQGVYFFIMAFLRGNEHHDRIRVNENYKMMTSRLSPQDWKTIRNDDYWTQRDKHDSKIQKQLFTIKWIRLWNETGQVGNGIRVPPRPEHPKGGLQPNYNFDELR